MSAIAERLASVEARVARACERAARARDEVTLLAVSKRHPVAAIREAMAAGQRSFGESYVKELAAKAAALPDASFHLIGHLQRNKAREAVAVARCVESVDSARLARELGVHADAAGASLDVFVQVNVGGEAQKSGCAPSEVGALVEAVRGERALRLRGLMTVPPWHEDPERARPFFRELAKLARAHALKELSMGMSADLEVAIEEGATLVRVGTAIFGPREVAAR